MEEEQKEIIGIRLTANNQLDLKIILAHRRQGQPDYNVSDAVREALRLLASKIRKEEKTK